MFVLSKGGVFDFDLNLLVEVLVVVDHQIEQIEDEIARSEDPDGFGHFDRMEGIIGLGFVACQQYIHATYPHLNVKSKYKAIQAPPMHSSGKAITEVINSAANLWKHRDEWRNRRNKADEERTRAVIGTVFPSSEHYVLYNVLYELLQPEAPRFDAVAHLLSQWRDLLIVNTS